MAAGDVTDDGGPPPAATTPPLSRPTLTPPGREPEPAGRGASTGLWIALAFAALLLAAAAVTLLLPRQVAGPEPAAATAAEPVDAAAAEAARQAARQGAEQALQAYLRRRAELELMNATAWGAGELDAAAAEAAAADRHFAQRRFAEAGSGYTAAGARLESLAATRDLLLDEALAAAAAALQADDTEGALAAYARALEIEPGNDAALAGSERARARALAHERFAAGREAEEADDLVTALAAYGEAQAVDPGYMPAVEALARVAATLGERRYQAAMSEALAALDGGRFTAAAQALDVAAGLRPGDAAVVDLRRQLATARQETALASLRRQAAERVAAEAWPEAAALYRKALAIEANAGFARAGQARAEERQRLHAALDRTLADPARLHSPEPLAEAGQLLAAVKVTADEPQLAAKLERLRQRVAEAQRPLPVTLRSDGVTEVAVYHVGRLGRFAEKRLELRPGSYTAVGTRAGYRDVRVLFDVRPGAPPPPVDVRCEEAL